MDQLRGQFNLKKSQVDQLKVQGRLRRRIAATPHRRWKWARRWPPERRSGKVAQAIKLKAELKIAETQVKMS